MSAAPVQPASRATRECSQWARMPARTTKKQKDAVAWPLGKLYGSGGGGGQKGTGRGLSTHLFRPSANNDPPTAVIADIAAADLCNFATRRPSKMSQPNRSFHEPRLVISCIAIVRRGEDQEWMALRTIMSTPRVWPFATITSWATHPKTAYHHSDRERPGDQRPTPPERWGFTRLEIGEPFIDAMQPGKPRHLADQSLHAIP
jgi:hypothetical protein